LGQQLTDFSSKTRYPVIVLERKAIVNAALIGSYTAKFGLTNRLASCPYVFWRILETIYQRQVQISLAALSLRASRLPLDL